MSLRLFVTRLATVVVFALPASFSFAADAPDRVARLNLVDGSVSFSPADTNEWVSATLNRPLTIGDRLWTGARSRAELHIGSTALRLASRTSLDVLNLDNDNVQLKVAEGIFSLRVRRLRDGDNVEVDTPNLAFVVREAGEYRFDVAQDGDSTTVTVRDGSGTAYGRNNRRFDMDGDQQAQFYGADLGLDFSEDAPRRDGFDRWVASRDEREEQAKSRRYISPEMTGYEDLDDYGSWREEPGYGAVWIPRVSVGWAPYHHGHWAWISPWGWTWVDDAPWGFAPFHYGRWAYLGSSWCWVPGAIVARPVYAPALVAFVGGGRNWNLSISAGSPGVAWFPLGPGDAFRPSYVSSTTYVTEINRPVHPMQDRRGDDYINRRTPGALAVMPRDAFQGGRPVVVEHQRLTPEKEREIRAMPVDAKWAIQPEHHSLFGAGRPAEMLPSSQIMQRDFVARKLPPELPAHSDSRLRKSDDVRGKRSVVEGRPLLSGAKDSKLPDVSVPVIRPERPRDSENRIRREDATERDASRFPLPSNVQGNGRAAPTPELNKGVDIQPGERTRRVLPFAGNAERIQTPASEPAIKVERSRVEQERRLPEARPQPAPQREFRVMPRQEPAAPRTEQKPDMRDMRTESQDRSRERKQALPAIPQVAPQRQQEINPRQPAQGREESRDRSPEQRQESGKRKRKPLEDEH